MIKLQAVCKLPASSIPGQSLSANRDNLTGWGAVHSEGYGGRPTVESIAHPCHFLAGVLAEDRHYPVFIPSNVPYVVTDDDDEMSDEAA